jgi:hypothetical protein
MSCVGPLGRAEAEALVAAAPTELKIDGADIPHLFVPLAHEMPPLSQKLLLELADPSTIQVKELMDELNMPAHARVAAEMGASKSDSFLTVADVFPPDVCARLRDAIDADCQVSDNGVVDMMMG